MIIISKNTVILTPLNIKIGGLGIEYVRLVYETVSTRHNNIR